MRPEVPEGRTLDRDMLLAFHEAAHAVTAESLVPDCLQYVTLNPTWGGRKVVPAASEACIQVDLEKIGTGFEFAVCVAASADGEALVYGLIDLFDPTRTGDENMLFDLSTDGVKVPKARKQATEIVTKNADRVRRLALALLERRYLTGDEAREVIGLHDVPIPESQETQEESA